MIIYDQSKTMLINCDNVNGIMINDGDDGLDIYASFGDGKNAMMGEYETQERTLEVLNEIMLSLANENCKVFIMPEK